MAYEGMVGTTASDRSSSLVGSESGKKAVSEATSRGKAISRTLHKASTTKEDAVAKAQARGREVLEQLRNQGVKTSGGSTEAVSGGSTADVIYRYNISQGSGSSSGYTRYPASSKKNVPAYSLDPATGKFKYNPDNTAGIKDVRQVLKQQAPQKQSESKYIDFGDPTGGIPAKQIADGTFANRLSMQSHVQTKESFFEKAKDFFSVKPKAGQELVISESPTVALVSPASAIIIPKGEYSANSIFGFLAGKSEKAKLRENILSSNYLAEHPEVSLSGIPREQSLSRGNVISSSAIEMIPVIGPPASIGIRSIGGQSPTSEDWQSAGAKSFLGATSLAAAGMGTAALKPTSAIPKTSLSQSISKVVPKSEPINLSKIKIIYQGKSYDIGEFARSGTSDYITPEYGLQTRLSGFEDTSPIIVKSKPISTVSKIPTAAKTALVVPALLAPSSPAIVAEVPVIAADVMPSSLFTGISRANFIAPVTSPTISAGPSSLVSASIPKITPVSIYGARSLSVSGDNPSSSVMAGDGKSLGSNSNYISQQPIVSTIDKQPAQVITSISDNYSEPTITSPVLDQVTNVKPISTKADPVPTKTPDPIINPIKTPDPIISTTPELVESPVPPKIGEVTYSNFKYPFIADLGEVPSGSGGGSSGGGGGGEFQSHKSKRRLFSKMPALIVNLPEVELVRPKSLLDQINEPISKPDVKKSSMLANRKEYVVSKVKQVYQGQTENLQPSNRLQPDTTYRGRPIYSRGGSGVNI